MLAERRREARAKVPKGRPAAALDPCAMVLANQSHPRRFLHRGCSSVVEQWPFKPWAGGSNPPTLIPVLLAACLACAPLLAEDMALENARAAAEALAQGKGDDAAAHLGKLLTFDLAPAVWIDARFALMYLRPPDLERLLARVQPKPWMKEEDLSRVPDLVQKVNREPAKAVDILAERLKTAPDDPVLLNLMAMAHEAMGRVEEAVEEYERARKAVGKPTCFWINLPHLSLARIHRAARREDDAYLLEREVVSWLTPLPDPREPLRTEGLEAGVRALRDVAYLRTQLAMALSNVGHYQGEREQYHAAIDSYRKSLAIEPRDATTWGNLSAAQFGVDDLKGALESIETALRFEPENEIYQKEREIILSALREGR